MQLVMIRWLKKDLWFPRVEDSTPEGVVAMGGDLSPERILLAYSRGIFPWYGPGQPILWWSPDPRGIIELEGFHVSRTLKKAIRKNTFQINVNTAFGRVIEECRRSHGREPEKQWLMDEMVRAYIRLHEMGYAHSLEAWQGSRLCGGLYGVALGGFFAGESMFYREPNASKVALAGLVERLRERGFSLLDCQMVTDATRPLGAVEISRQDYLMRLGQALQRDCSFA